MHVAYCYGGPNLARLSGSGVHLHVLPATSSHSPALAWKIIQLVRHVQPDIVQTWLLQMEILGGIAALVNRVPFILSERSSAGAYPPSLKTRLRQLVGRNAACVIANSRSGLEYWRVHLPPERIVLVRNGIVPPDQTGQPLLGDAASSIAGRPLVLFAGRFSWEKNIPCLIDALTLVARQHPDAAIMMFGEGPEKQTTLDRIAKVGMQHRIGVSGYSSQLGAWMARANVCVSVSHFEGHSNVVMEAAAGGCPLVLSDIPSHRELFDDSSALMAPADSPSHIADAVLETLRNPIQARERAQRARAVALAFDLPTVAATYKSIYETIAATSH